MDRKDFGKFVALRRNQNVKLDENFHTRPWSQADLARESGLTLKQVQRVEQGTVKTLDVFKEFVDKLAAGLCLHEAEKVTFYAKAGFHYTAPPQQESRTSLRELLKQMHYPASIRTPLWDFVAFNEYHRQLYGYTDENIESLQQDVLGPNLLKVVFDKQFANHVVGPTAIRHQKVIESFRISAFPYIDTPRYRMIVGLMMKYRPFQKIWHESRPLFEDDIHRPEPSALERTTRWINHPDHGQMSFLALRVPQLYLSEYLTISVYVPLAESEAAYAKFIKSVGNNNVTYFGDQ